MPAPFLSAALAAGVLSVGMLSTAACGQERAADPVRPLARTATTDPTPAPRPGATPHGGAVTTTLDVTGPDTADSNTAAPDAAGAADAATVELVAESLARYGALLGDLAADPAGAPAPGSPARASWDSLVLPGSPLSVELLERLTQRAVEQRMVIRPGPDGVSYRHTPVRVDAVTTDERGQVITFRWCGWSPGIGRSIDTGAVLDDAVAHAAGSGHLRRVGGAWLIASLDEEDLELLAPGSPDPCPDLPGSAAR